MMGSKQASSAGPRPLCTVACSGQNQLNGDCSDRGMPIKVEIAGSWVDVVGAPGVTDVDVR
jgi:hypothetical protein